MQAQSTLPGDGVLKSNSSSTTIVNIRSGPSTNNSVKRQGKSGDPVKVLEKTKPANDTRSWYKVKYGNGSDDIGWVREDVIQLVEKNPSDASTLLYFATDTKTVRVYTEQGQIFMNVYDNRSELTELNSAPAARVPRLEATIKWNSFIAIKDRFAYSARFIPFGETELIISGRNDGVVTLRQNGFRSSGTEYQRD
jgi:hypothetical protein